MVLEVALSNGLVVVFVSGLFKGDISTAVVT
jgi:hypothetical protein